MWNIDRLTEPQAALFERLDRSGAPYGTIVRELRRAGVADADMPPPPPGTAAPLMTLHARDMSDAEFNEWKRNPGLTDLEIARRRADAAARGDNSDPPKAA